VTKMIALCVAWFGFTLSFAQTGPELCGCPVLPPDNIWNAPVDTLPLDPSSAAYLNTIGLTRAVHPDFGSGLWDGGPIGIPYTVVYSTEPKVPISFDYDDESDPGPYPIPPDAAIEGGAQATGDRHVLVLDRDTCRLYETFYSFPQPDGSWRAGSGAVFDLLSHALRPAGWTSADAAGLPILPGLVRYDEVAAGEIKHAIRFTVPQTRRAYVWPARHYASSLTDLRFPPMGQRFRLRASFDVSSFSPEVQVILRALKRYGMILADNGSAWFLSGVPDPRWNNDVLVGELGRVKGSDFEAVDVSSLMTSPDSGQVRGAVAPARADMRLSVSDSPDPVAFDTRLTYTVRVQNAGPDQATNVVVSDNFPPECALSSVSTPFGTYTQSGNQLVFNLGSLPAASSATIMITVRPTSPAFRSLTNYAEVTASEPDPDAANNQVTTVTTVRKRARR